MMMYDDDDGDLMSIVRSCSRMKRKEMIASTLAPSASDPFSYFPPLPPPPQFPMRMEERLPNFFSNLFSMNRAMFEGLEDIVMPFSPRSQSQQQQTGLFPSLSSVGSGACPTTMRISEPSQKRPPSKQPQKPQAVASYKKRKDEKKMVVMENSIISNDNWAWHKYGEKPIKDCTYRRSYYKCSTSKSCPARKMVDKSQMEPKTFVITYTAEHIHPLPTHRNCAAGTTRKEYSTSSSGRRKAKGAEASSSTTPLKTTSLMEEDKKIVGEDELLFLGDPILKTPAAAGYSSFFDYMEDPFLLDTSNIYFGVNNGGAAAAGGDGANKVN